MNWKFWVKKKVEEGTEYKSGVREHTLDYLWLLQKSNPEKQFLFYSGTLPPWYGEAVQTAFTVEKLSLWFSYGLPISFRMKALQVPRARIKGSLYLLTSEQIADLDAQSGVGVYCERKNLPIILPELDANGLPYQTRSWMYIANKEYYEPKIEWDQTFYRNNTQYIRADVIKDNRPWLNDYYDDKMKDISFGYQQGNRRAA